MPITYLGSKNVNVSIFGTNHCSAVYMIWTLMQFSYICIIVTVRAIMSFNILVLITSLSSYIEYIYISNHYIFFTLPILIYIYIYIPG